MRKRLHGYGITGCVRTNDYYNKRVCRTAARSAGHWASQGITPRHVKQSYLKIALLQVSFINVHQNKLALKYMPCVLLAYIYCTYHTDMLYTTRWCHSCSILVPLYYTPECRTDTSSCEGQHAPALKEEEDDKGHNRLGWSNRGRVV